MKHELYASGIKCIQAKYFKFYKVHLFSDLGTWVVISKALDMLHLSAPV
jgi:hypothetical protein